MYCEAIVPPALGRLSTTTCWPDFSVIFSPIQRASMSVWLPAANGTSMRTGRVGYGSAAPALAAHAAATTESIKPDL